MRSKREPRTDGEATRSRILEAAGKLFSMTGYAETSGKAIAAEAAVDVASINYHFGSRSGLYQAVLFEAHRRLVDLADLQQLLDSPLAPPARLARLIERLVDEALGEPRGWHLHVLAREVMAPSSHLHTLIRDAVGPKLAVIKRILSEITGIPVDDPALLRCLISVGAPCMMLLVGGSHAPGPLHEVFRMPRQAIVDHLVSFALSGLETIGRDYARRTR
ncbi:TetR/AcrR family transcriptional regulator [Massilia sp. ST3]|uniref:TetR/AcrR family transcriptional regulator n=1 Tax=Massilia sp. ST3 TaxID=2824903 RepID=UPI001B840F79|nr:CerR family C-terminal domain-containing protein [Massilia sp. ST3]MBQ5947977.1 CerR family C-terminal domain-containing protein [Massilia sp. ST3]